MAYFIFLSYIPLMEIKIPHIELVNIAQWKARLRVRVESVLNNCVTICYEDRYYEKQATMHVIIAKLLPYEFHRANTVKNLVILVCKPFSRHSRA